MDIADIYWETNKDNFKRFIIEMLEAYQKDTRYTIKRYYNEEKLEGFCVIRDIDGIRILSEAHYIGNNKYIALKMLKFMTKGATKIQASVLRSNTNMIDFLKRIHCEIIDDSQPLSII